MSNISFRPALPEDCPLILSFIKALAEYEKMSDQVVATEELLKEWIFEKGKAEVIFPVVDGEEVGFALFFHNFSTFLGRAGIYLEDLFIKPEHGLRKGHLAAAGAHSPGARLRAAGMGLPGLEPAQHRLLPLPGRHAHG